MSFGPINRGKKTKIHLPALINQNKTSGLFLYFAIKWFDNLTEKKKPLSALKPRLAILLSRFTLVKRLKIKKKAKEMVDYFISIIYFLIFSHFFGGGGGGVPMFLITFATFNKMHFPFNERPLFPNSLSSLFSSFLIFY